MKITNADLLRRAHRNQIILDSKIVHATLLGIISWYILGMNSDSRFVNIIPPALTAGIIYADTKSRKRKLRNCAANKDAWIKQSSQEIQNNVKNINLGEQVGELFMVAPGSVGAPTGNTGRSSSQPPRGGPPPKSPHAMPPNMSEIRGLTSKKSDGGIELPTPSVHPLVKSESVRPASLAASKPLVSTSPVRPMVNSGLVRPVAEPAAKAAAKVVTKPPLDKTTEIPEIPQSPEPVKGADGEVLKGAPRIEDQQHLGLIGPTRSGKTSTLYNLLGGKKTVTYVSMKMTDEVPTHWSGIYVTRSNAVEEFSKFCDYMDSKLTVHCDATDSSGREEEWFVIDEALSAISILKKGKGKDGAAVAERLQSLIVAAAALGMGVGFKLCLLSQSPNAGSLGISVPDMKNFSWVVAASEICPSGFSEMVPYYRKLSGLKVSSVSEKMISKLTGFWQLWSWKGSPVLGQAERVTLKMKPLEPIESAVSLKVLQT